MTSRLVLAALILLAAAIAARRLQARGHEAPTNDGAAVPAHLDRADFTRPGAPWLVVVFSSRTCASCAAVVAAATRLESDDVAVEEVEYSNDRERHRRYGVDSVPTLVIVDAEGITRSSFVGAVDPAALESALRDVGA